MGRVLEIFEPGFNERPLLLVEVVSVFNVGLKLAQAIGNLLYFSGAECRFGRVSDAACTSAVCSDRRLHRSGAWISRFRLLSQFSTNESCPSQEGTCRCTSALTSPGL